MSPNCPLVIIRGRPSGSGIIATFLSPSSFLLHSSTCGFGPSLPILASPVSSDFPSHTAMSVLRRILSLYPVRTRSAGLAAAPLLALLRHLHSDVRVCPIRTRSTDAAAGLPPGLPRTYSAGRPPSASAHMFCGALALCCLVLIRSISILVGVFVGLLSHRPHRVGGCSSLFSFSFLRTMLFFSGRRSSSPLGPAARHGSGPLSIRLLLSLVLLLATAVHVLACSSCVFNAWYARGNSRCQLIEPASESQASLSRRPPLEVSWVMASAPIK